MFLFDLHCDTLTEANERGRGLMNGELSLSIDRLPGRRWCQCFAIFMPDELRGEGATIYFDRNVRFFRAQMNLHASYITPVRTTAELDAALDAGKIAAILTVEGGSALAGDISNIRKLAMAGVKILTLTWNGENELAGGQAAGTGFSFFGRMAVAVLEQNNIVLDVSHLSDTAFWELAKFAKRPFVATHSNARAVCNHPRNLTDEQFLHIVKIGGLVGINFYPAFINGGEDAAFEELKSHIDHFLALGGENALAIGSDFDGAKMMSWLRDVREMPVLYEKMTAAYGQELCDKIFGENALAFFRRYEALGLLLDTLRNEE